jgi:ribosomal protein L9
VDKRRIELDDHIKQLGTYDVTIRYYGGVTATVKVWVVRA